MTLSDIAPLGDNQPNILAQGEAITLRLQKEHAALLNLRNELLAAEARLPALPVDADAPESAKKVTEYIAKITALSREAEKIRIADKEPYLSGGRHVDGFWNGIIEPLDDPKKKALKQRTERKLTLYNEGVVKRERARRDEELKLAREAEMKRLREEQDAFDRAAAAEAANAPLVADVALNQAVEAAQTAAAATVTRIDAERAVSASAADLTRVRSDYGAFGSLQRFLDFQPPDRSTLDLEKLRDHFNDDAFDKAVRSYMRANSDAIKASLDGGARHELKGVRFFLSSRTTVR